MPVIDYFALLSKGFLSGHFKKLEISFRALKPRPACVPLNLPLRLRILSEAGSPGAVAGMGADHVAGEGSFWRNKC